MPARRSVTAHRGHALPGEPHLQVPAHSWLAFPSCRNTAHPFVKFASRPIPGKLRPGPFIIQQVRDNGPSLPGLLDGFPSHAGEPQLPLIRLSPMRLVRHCYVHWSNSPWRARVFYPSHFRAMPARSTLSRTAYDVSNGKHWTRCFSHDTLRDAPDENMRQARSTVGR